MRDVTGLSSNLHFIISLYAYTTCTTISYLLQGAAFLTARESPDMDT